MDLINTILQLLKDIDVMPALIGAVAGLYVQSDEYAKISVRRAMLVFISSLATAHFVGTWACAYFGLDLNGSNALKFGIATYTPDIMEASSKIVDHYKENPLGILKSLIKKKQNEEIDANPTNDGHAG